MERIGAIYMLTNTVNGKAYVGQTWATPETRWKQHVAFARKGKGMPIASAIRKHGAEAFRLNVMVEGVQTQDLLDLLESDCINTFGTMDAARGYNAKHGGAKGKMSQATREKISRGKMGWIGPVGNKNRLGDVQSAETRAKISAAKKGKRMSPSHCQKMRESMTRVWARRKSKCNQLSLFH